MAYAGRSAKAHFSVGVSKAIAGATKGFLIDAWSQLSPQDRAYATAVFNDLMTSDFTPSEKEMLFGAYQDLKARLLKLRETNA